MAESITGFALLRNNQLWLNGKLMLDLPGTPPADFFSQAYNTLNLNYPKFFKMDNLCKAGFVASEILLRDMQLKERYQPMEIGLVLSNANSSLDTDIKYKASTATTPSPGLFVYTLPNILIGEICIRQGIKGESACLIFDIFDPAFQTEYVHSILEGGQAKTFVSGWADFYAEKFEAFFYLVEQSTNPGLAPHNKTEVEKIYKGTWKN